MKPLVETSGFIIQKNVFYEKTGVNCEIIGYSGLCLRKPRKGEKLDMSTSKHAGLRKAGTAATVAALTFGMAGATAITALADEPTAGRSTGSDNQTTPDTGIEYTATVAGEQVSFTKDADGNYSANVDSIDQMPASKLVVLDQDAKQVTTLNLQRNDAPDDTSVVGVVKKSGSATYTGRATAVSPTFTVNIGKYSQKFGQPVQYAGKDITEGEPINLGTTKLPDDNNPTDTFKFNDKVLGFDWGDLSTDTSNGTYTLYRQGTSQDTINLTNVGAGIDKTWVVQFTKRAVRSHVWNTTVDGKDYTFTLDNKGVEQVTLDKGSSYPQDKITVDGSSKFDMPGSITVSKADPSSKLGQVDVEGSVTYDKAADPKTPTPAFHAERTFAYTGGTALTIKGSRRNLLKGTNGKTYYTKVSTLNLGPDNEPTDDSKQIVLTDGEKDVATADINWAKDENGKPDVTVEDKTVDGATSKFVRRVGTADGTVKVTDPGSGKTMEVPFHIIATADRAQDKSFTGLTVTRTDAKGQTTVYDGTKDFDQKFSPDVHEYTLTLPASATGDSYTLGLTRGVDSEAGTPTIALGEGASRVLKVTVNGVEYKVNVKFQTSDIQADSPAKLSGIYVNRTGENTKGQLIDNWNPNRLDYVLALGEKDPSPYVLPEAPEGVTIKGGNVTQNAQSTKQEWIVTDTASGVSRTYSLTVTRPVKTAVTEFKPNDPAKQDPSEDVKTPQDTDLTSHGYVGKDGKYVKADKDTYEIPEGGAFAYEPKNGQSATVTVSHEGMTYMYTVNVLAQDGYAFAQHTYKVTYITQPTHLAQLTGILVDGTSVNGFDPAKREYTAAVNDPNEWMISPQYDKTTGMSVSTEKNGSDAIITVTSGDGLEKAVYKVHVTKKLLGGDGNSAMGLAETGVGASVLSWIVGILIILGGAIGIFATVRKPKSSDDGESPEDPTGTQPNEASKSE